jgi:ribosome-binding factor A
MTSPRRNRLAEELRNEIAVRIRREIRDPRVGFVTLTSASVSPDLTHARIYVTVLGDDKVKQASLQALNRASGYLQRAVFKRLRLRRSLEIVFVLDEAVATGGRIEELLDRIHGDREEQSRDEKDGKEGGQEE